MAGRSFLENLFPLTDKFMDQSKLDKLSNESKQIEEDSMYNAEVHYLIGTDLGRKAFRFKFIPAIVTVLGALALLWGAPNWIVWITLLGGLVTVAGILKDFDRKSAEHFSAGQDFTALKHEARSLHESFSAFLDDNSFYYNVRLLRERYNLLAKKTPPTDDEEAFQKARENIQSGRHKADFRDRPKE